MFPRITESHVDETKRSRMHCKQWNIENGYCTVLFVICFIFDYSFLLKDSSPDHLALVLKEVSKEALWGESWIVNAYFPQFLSLQAFVRRTSIDMSETYNPGQFKGFTV